MSSFYRHVAPLERKAVPNPHRHVTSVERKTGVRASDDVHVSPLWGLGYLVYRVFYKHVAPLGLCRLIGKFDSLIHWTSKSYVHSTPLECGVWHPLPIYRHIAPLERGQSLSFFFSPSSASLRLCVKLFFIRVDWRMACSFHVSRITFQNRSYFNSRHSIGPLYSVNRFAVRSPIHFANFRLPVNRYAVYPAHRCFSTFPKSAIQRFQLLHLARPFAVGQIANDNASMPARTQLQRVPSHETEMFF